MSAGEAVNQFKKQFKSKTGVNWEQRHGMEAKTGLCFVSVCLLRAYAGGRQIPLHW